MIGGRYYSAPLVGSLLYAVLMLGVRYMEIGKITNMVVLWNNEK